jgi:uncharacterized protein with von Willebrand factor type A (vWA) domain
MSRPLESPALAIDLALRLAGALREQEVPVGVQQTEACVTAIDLLRECRPDHLLRLCRLTLVNRRRDHALLERLFRQLLILYQLSPEALAEAAGRAHAVELTVRQQLHLGLATAAEDSEDGETEGYSLREVDGERDLRLLPPRDFPRVLALFERIARAHASIARRRRERSRRRGLLDLRASLRESWRYDGEILRWHHRRRRRTRTRLTVVVDLSGSMEVYGVFLLNFLHALARSRWLRIEVFAFSTVLGDLRPAFRRRDFRLMQGEAARLFPGWSGGTRIGWSLQTLHDSHPEALGARTLLAIMSDGWDTGEIPLLERAMAALARRVRGVVWINPLKGDPAYEPLARGMMAALPHCDHFIAGHSIDSLGGFAGLLAAAE